MDTEEQVKISAKRCAKDDKRLGLNMIGGFILIILIVSRMSSVMAEQSSVDETTNPVEDYAVSPISEEGISVVDETTDSMEEYAVLPIPEEGMSVVDETTNPIEEPTAPPVPEEGIDIWFAEFGQYYNEFEYAYCDIDMDGSKEILIQSPNDGGVVVEIYIMSWDPFAGEYRYLQADSLSHVGDWQWYAVEEEGLYAVVLYEGWQYIYRVTKNGLYVETEYISYGELHGEPAVYENPLFFTQY